jgi:hypothetical protein
MVEPGSSEEISLALINAALLLLWPVLPGLLIGYARQALAARHIRPQFALHKSETLELDRAVQLYEQVYRRLKSLEKDNEGSPGFWQGLFHRERWGDRNDDEIENLQAHAQLLRETIVRLKRRPLKRLTSWIRLISSKSALGRGAAAYVASIVLLVFVFHGPEQPAWADELATGANIVLAWYPFDERVFYANAVATGFAAAALPLFYLARWIGLRREYRCEFCWYRELARSDPAQPVDRIDIDDADEDTAQLAETTETDLGKAWFAVLGLSSAATIEEAKEAYKRLVKQNHPDRVHDLSPALRKLAEAETKRLNAAFRQALMARARTATADSATN